MSPGVFVLLALSLWAGGCAGQQSTLDPAGLDADRIAQMTWVMVVGAVIIWAAVVALGWFFGQPHEAAPSRRRDFLLIVVGGVIVPVVVLTSLLVYGLRALPEHLAHAPDGSLTIDVVGRQWWWDVRYHRDGRDPVITANEIRLPVDAPVQFRLASDNVLHSFWVPALGGKMDMIPGRVTHLRLHPTRTGVFLGACAEYCGTAHALMRLRVVVMPHDQFDAWLASQAAPARVPATPMAAGGQDAFVANGCGACHRVGGTAADGRVGPDLTHVASRTTIGAETTPMTGEHLRRWITDAGRIKPGVHMPTFAALPVDDLQAITAYLETLR
jgi:cytochrome c oxidase subunit 2